VAEAGGESGGARRQPRASKSKVRRCCCCCVSCDYRRSLPAFSVVVWSRVPVPL
jgi:hypothetical protein